jgi:hypothetical protein
MLAPIHSLSASQQGSGRVIWGLPSLLSAATQDGAFIPVIRSNSNSRLLVIYNQVTEQGVENPYYRESLDGGKSWHEASPVQVSDDELLQATFDFDQAGEAHAIWRTQTEIWHSAESQWPYASNLITATDGLVFNPDISVGENGTLHVVWAQEDNRIYYAQSVDGGNSWQGETALTWGLNKSDQPAVAADEAGNVHVVWEERVFDPDLIAFRYEIRYLMGISETLGLSWSSSSALLSGDVVNAQQPDIIARDGHVDVAFARRDRIDDVNQEHYAYYVSYSPALGWSEPRDVTHDPVIVNSNVPFVLVPELVTCDEVVYLYYHGAPADNSKEIILGASSSDNWERRDQVDVGSARAIRPSAICLAGKLHLVYEKVIRPNVDHQIYYISGNRYAAFIPVAHR